ncbi:hypothetical protein D6827_03045, partial [Candidatus Parcubacteria bacterium]
IAEKNQIKILKQALVLFSTLHTDEKKMEYLIHYTVSKNLQHYPEIAKIITEHQDDKLWRQAISNTEAFQSFNISREEIIAELLNIIRKAARHRYREPLYKINAIKNIDFETYNVLLRVARRNGLYSFATGSFFRQKMHKTGAPTILLDTITCRSPSLKSKAIIRQFHFAHFNLWRRAYEAAGLWKELGFDYIPIEPIIKARWKNDLTVNVFTRVIPGPSAQNWLAVSNLHEEYIRATAERIDQGLDKLGFYHSHDHFGNFVLLFPKKNDRPDIFQKPRLYMIDFDAAAPFSVFDIVPNAFINRIIEQTH